MRGFFVVALVLFFLSGVKGSPLQTLGGIKEEPAETEIERPQDWDDDSWRALMRMLDRNVETIDLNGVRYRLISADYLDFFPLKIR